MAAALPIEPDDSIRTPDSMKPADAGLGQGRWLDVPRLPQFNGQRTSWLWCGRAAAAMVYDYYCRVQGKQSEYVAHLDGDPGPGPNGKYRENLRYKGGAHKGELAGLNASGKCYPAGTFEKAGWTIAGGYLQKSAKEPISTARGDVEDRFAPLLEQIDRSNPVVLFSRLSVSNSHGHIVVVSGYKRLEGELWLRITDPTSPHDELIGKRNLILVQRNPSSFSEYWVRASRLLEQHSDGSGKTLLHYMEDARLGRFTYVADQKVDAGHEVVHVVGTTPSKAAPKGSTKPAVPPKDGNTALPFERREDQLDARTVTALYHASERGAGGYFPLGESGAFHCGAHFALDRGTKLQSIAAGEVVAARLSGSPGSHPWGDTGFVLLRHRLEGDKALFSLHLHLEAEPLHPDRARAGWLRRLLVAAMGGADAKPKWRLDAPAHAWKDEDKGRFSPTNVQLDVTIAPGLYEEQARLVEDHATYVKLEGGWIRAALQDGEGAAHELSPWTDFDLDVAAKNSAAVKALREGKVAVLDADKDEKGARRWTVRAGETLGVAGTYLGAVQVHWSVFSTSAVFPSGKLPDKEYGEKDEVKLEELDLSSKDAGDVEHAKALVEALDPKKKTPVGKADGNILAPGEARHFFRTPTECWRSRYLAVKGTADFALDVDAYLALERHKSHGEAERKAFQENAKAFVFWKDLSGVEGLPDDGKAVFVHPVTALRLMAGLHVAADHDDPPAAGEREPHPHEDVTIALRDGKGPLAGKAVTIRAGSAELFKGTTDNQGLLLVPLSTVADREVEIALDDVPDKAQLTVVSNDTGAPKTLTPGEPQTYNGVDALPDARLGVPMKVREGQHPGAYAEWNANTFQVGKKLRELSPGETLDVERIAFRREDGSHELVEAHVDGRRMYVWAIWNGERNLDATVHAAGSNKDDAHPIVIAAWSSRTAHVNDHPVLSGRVKNLDDGAELTVTFCAMIATGSAEHDEELLVEKTKVAKGGFAVAFDPHQLAADHDLLAHPQPVYAKVKARASGGGAGFAGDGPEPKAKASGGGAGFAGDGPEPKAKASNATELSLRGAAITIYAGARVPEPAPAPPQTATGARRIVAFTEVARTSPLDGQEKIDRHRTMDGKEPKLRKLSQLASDLRARFVETGGDELWFGTVAGEMHLATEDQAEMTAAQAITAQREALKALDPDAPLDRLFAPPEDAPWHNRGMTVGICAQDCKEKVDARGVKSGCTEEIRTKNLLSCSNVPLNEKKPKNKGSNLCSTAVPEPEKRPLKAVHCYSSLGTCHHVRHDKSKCFLQTVVRGRESEERERWYVSIPLITDDWRNEKHRKWPYHGNHAGASEGTKVPPHRNLRVLLVNPQNGNAVICSMEDFGPSGNESEGNAAIPQAGIARDELLGMGHLCGLSPEVSWKLGFMHGHGNPVVLMAFVPADTPLGPVAEGVTIQLRKRATYLQIMGVDPVPEKP